MNKKLELDRKYAELLLKKCLCFKNTDSLLIEYMTKEQDDFVEVIIGTAKEMGIKKIDLKCEDSDLKHDYLKNTNIEDIKLNEILDRSIWDEYALKHGCILHIDTFIPNLMNDIDSAKITAANKIMIPTFKNYRENNLKYNFPWVICAYPNERWADFLFPNDNNSFEKLYDYIIKMCMIDREDPIKEWDEFIKQSTSIKNKLQDMQIEKMHYKNSLGTDFEIGLPENVQWINLDKKDRFGNPIVVNMPSYEIFTAPDNKTANGIVYNSRPLVFQNEIIDKFYIEFKDGVAINYNAKYGNEYLKKIIENYTNSNKLGEVALVNNDLPISNTNTVFYNTLFDENASCHLALGRGNPNTILNGKYLTKEELENQGINQSNIHVDFMIGTKDLEIDALCKNGQKVKLFKKGNFNL